MDSHDSVSRDHWNTSTVFFISAPWVRGTEIVENRKWGHDTITITYFPSSEK